MTRPAAVTDLQAARVGDDVRLTWSPVTTDVTGQPETVLSYRIYRGTVPDFVPDTASGSNRVGTSPTAQFDDPGAALDGPDYFYLVSGVDEAGNESATKPTRITGVPFVSGTWTDNSIDLIWTAAEPAAQVTSYRVYCGRRSQVYETVFEVGLATAYSVTGLDEYVNWYCAVVAVDAVGNESPFSNEHVDAIAGRVRVRAQDDDEICWLSGGASCPPRPGAVQRSDGFQILVPTEFPVGNWTRVLVTLTMDSRLCTPPAQGTTTKCGSTNPGGYNPCGDPWDRIAHLFLVLDDCIESGGSCITHQNLELMRAITPFGTDALPPDGTGVVPPRALTLDITPYVPFLTGQKYVGVEIGHYVQAGWHVTVDFEFSERADEASPKPPADGFVFLGFGNAPLPVRQVSIPATATSVKMRLFTTGHGGNLYCEGGINTGLPCVDDADCPGGACNPCDEFCKRINRLLRNGASVWNVIPWRSDCSPAGNPCSNWNACGYPSCTFPRSGWCPGYIACHKNDPCSQDIVMNPYLPPGGTWDVQYVVVNQTGYWPVSAVIYWYE